MDSLAEATGSPAAIIIDALNESQNPRRWLKELPALISAAKAHPHVAIVVSFRSDYEQLVMPEDLMDLHAHLGLAGHEHEALEKYCALFEVPVPSTASLNTSFTNPLFLRMYCDILATESGMGLDAPTMSNLFDRFAAHRIDDVIEKLALPPTSPVIRKALNHVCDTLLANYGRPIPRGEVEAACEELLPGRPYPMTLFKQMVTEGVLELAPDLTGEGELVTLAFQAYSEHHLARRLLETITSDDIPASQCTEPRLAALARRLESDAWLWRAFAVVLPEEEGVELVDLLPAGSPTSRLHGAMFDSYADRATESFTERTRQLFDQQCSLSNPEGIDTRIRLGTRIEHAANADWLHQQLAALPLPDRDATWTIGAFDAHEESAAYLRLKTWAASLVTDETSTEEIRLAALVLMWLLTSSNRYLRDDASKTLALLLSKRLDVVPDLFTAARSADDPYVQERALTCAYGAVIAGGDAQPKTVTDICVALADWLDKGLPVHVLARDSALGIAARAAGLDLVDAATLDSFRPPYGSSPPEEPPTAHQLDETHGLVKDGEDYREWRAYSILASCLTWMGDFNKYVIKGDVDYFSRLPLTGPPPDDWRDPLNEVEADWAGRWVANRAIELGWTADRFEEFERSRDLHSGRDSHKAERIGKKYQWIALHELLARLADNNHPARQSWDDGPVTFEVPWPWYGRDFDPTLPPGTAPNPRMCSVALTEESWPWLDVDLEGPAIPDGPNEWVARTADLPSPEAVFFPIDETGHQWVALSRVARWSTENEEQRNRLSAPERHISLHQFGWLVPSGFGPKLAELVDEHLDQIMREARRPHGQYLGEQSWAPIAHSGKEQEGLPERVTEAGITWLRRASEQWVWEGHVLDCSLDNMQDLMLPTAELLGDAVWVPHEAAWSHNGQTVCRSLERPSGSGHTTLVADQAWLTERLEDLKLDLVVTAFGERQFLPDVEGRTIAWAKFTYITCLGTEKLTSGPDLEVQGRVGEQASGQ